MKQLFLGVTVVCGVALLGGCPVYSNDRYCNDTGCYDCPAHTTPANGTCIQWTCSSSNDCGPGYICDSSTYACVVASGCDQCPHGYVCKLSSAGAPQCTPSAVLPDAGSDASVVDAGRLDSAVIDARADVPDSFAPDAVTTPDSTAVVSDAAMTSHDGPSGEASVAPDAAVIADTCNGNAACGLDGSKCIDGRCAPVTQLCSDTTQCVVADEACVDGVCVPHCSPSSPCPAGYGCDFTRGVCDLNPAVCTGSGTSTCVGGSVCVEGRCVAPCVVSDTASSCPGTQVCINGGCIPDEAARFACKNDGQSGLLANECMATEICLHHDCYPACDPDGGACADLATSCKQVRVTEGTYAVCALPSNLGSDCDPGTGKYCTTGVCIDGYCR